MYNRLISMGRLTRDPELHTTQNGVKHCSMNVIADHVTFCGDREQTSAANEQQNQLTPLSYRKPYQGQYPPPQNGNGYY